MALQTGDRIPHFTAKDANGKDFDSDSIVGKKPVVIYFYPKDETRICTLQACSFRDQYQDFNELGAEVIGISGDSVASHEKFKNNHQLPFVLLADPKNTIRKQFGVPNDWLGLVAGRATYVADATGTIIMVFDSTDGVAHIQKALEALKNI